tara:strand:+ start:2088 stop:2453 length:366 start_codon:yes stop_codon:yes gene_type:complete
MAMEHAAAWNAGDADKIAGLFAKNGSITVNGGEPHVGRAEIGGNALELLATFPGLVVRCHETRHAGDRAVFIWTLEGNHAKTGNFVSLPGWHEWELDGDMRVKHCRGFFDVGDFERQIAGV